MSLYDYIEQKAKDKGYKSMNDFCDKAGISSYILGRLKWNASIRSDIKAKIAKALKTDMGTINQLIIKAQQEQVLQTAQAKAAKNTVFKEVEVINAKANAEPEVQQEETDKSDVIEEIETEPVQEDVEELNDVEEVMEETMQDVVVDEPVIKTDEVFKKALDKLDDKRTLKGWVPPMGGISRQGDDIARLRQEKTAANLEFVYNNINAFRELHDAFYLRQAQVYLSKMIENAD